MRERPARVVHVSAVELDADSLLRPHGVDFNELAPGGHVDVHPGKGEMVGAAEFQEAIVELALGGRGFRICEEGEEAVGAAAPAESVEFAFVEQTQHLRLVDRAGERSVVEGLSEINEGERH